MTTSIQDKGPSTAAWFWMIAGAVTLARVLLLVFSPTELGPDEAQYWYWSRHPDFGYFSKPPLIAWAIWVSTSLFGNAEWAVRLTAPFFHLGAAAFLFLLGRRAYGKRVGFWAGIAWLATPGVNLSSFVIATDAPLLFFWSGALFFLHRLCERRGEARADLFDSGMLGLMVGLGMLSKYAMVYFPIALALALALSPQLRARLLRPELFLAAAVAALLTAPNVAWNMAHDFRTFAHTAGNAHWSDLPFHPLNLLQFLGAQLAVFGVIPGATFVWILTRRRRRRRGDGADSFESALLAFALTPLAIISLQAFISKAYANWAATAYPAAIVLATAWLFRLERLWLAKASVYFHAGLAVVFAVCVLNFTFVDGVGATRTLRDVRGWRAQTDVIVDKAAGYDAIVIDDRYLVGEALYYQRHAAVDIVTIDVNQNIQNHFEAFVNFDPARHRRVLFVSTRNDAAHVDYRFASIKPLGPATVKIGDLRRSFYMFDISDYFGPGAPNEDEIVSAPTAAPR